MPIQCHFAVDSISQPQFYEVDYRVMNHAFNIQNELGRLCNESIYQSEMIHRCMACGFTAVSEGEIVVSVDSFKKSYYLDAVIAQGVIYELKAVSALNGQHESQLLNYLFLSNLQHGKLINFAATSVQSRFVSTNIDSKKRFSFTVDDHACARTLSSSKILREIGLHLLAEWGAFLDIHLYRDAIHHFLGGVEALMQPVELFVNGRLVGRQKMGLLDHETALHISSVIHHLDSYKKQLHRLIEHTHLKQIQWLNFNRDILHLITLNK